MRILICVLAALASPSVVAQAVDDSQTAIETVLVEGQQPGPRLWKLNKDGHVLWLLGTLSPLPKRLEWRSREVEEVLSRAPAVIEQESLELDADFFSRIRAKRSIRRAMYAPQKATLDTVLPPELYARWSQMKQAYLPKDQEVEKLRPVPAVARLWAAALEKTGLSDSSRIQATVRNLAHERRIKPTTLTIKYKLDSLRKIVGDIQQMSHEAEIACMNRILDVIEVDIETTRQRANAWAIGDLAALERLPEPQGSSGGCRSGMTEWKRLKAEARDLWFETVDAAVASNAETLAVLSLDDLLGDDSRLKSLANRGYVLESMDAEADATSAAAP